MWPVGRDEVRRGEFAGLMEMGCYGNGSGMNVVYLLLVSRPRAGATNLHRVVLVPSLISFLPSVCSETGTWKKLRGEAWET